MTLLNPDRTALVLIDMQGAVRNHAAEPHSADDVIKRASRLVEATRKGGGLVIYVRTSFLVDESDSLAPLPIDRKRPLRPTRPEGWDQIVPELATLPTEPIVVKRSWNAFHGSDLALQLQRHGIETIVLAGISTNFGVEGTARAAYEHGYPVIFVEEAMATNTAENHAFALREIFPQIGRVRDLETVLAALSGQALTNAS